MEQWLQEGKKLPLVEDFYTIQGEGYHAGTSAYFIRLGGCDVGCAWCDSKNAWNPLVFPPVPIEEIVERATVHPAKSIVITGGEPLNYPLGPLCKELKARGMTIFIETSGSSPLSGEIDWICLSPKQHKPPLPEIYSLAHELKVIVSGPLDLEWAEWNRTHVRPTCQLFLQPEWSRREEVLPLLVSYVKAHPEWHVSLQIHKYMHIP